MQFKLAALLAAVLAVILAAPDLAAQTCPCATFDLAAVVKNADAIFVGRSLTATTDSTPPSGDSTAGWTDAGVEFQTRLAFEVETAIKGNLPRFVEVISPIGPCGFRFSVGERYLVTGKVRGTAVATDSCKGNLSGSELVEARTAAIRELLRAPIDRASRLSSR